MRLQWSEIRARAAAFSDAHKHDRRETGDTQTFYNDFFDCFGVSRRQVATYEQRVRNLPGDNPTLRTLSLVLASLRLTIRPASITKK